MSALHPHRKPIPGVTPALAYLAKHVDKAAGHWFWRDGRRNHGHDARGQATLRWTVTPTHKTQFVAEGVYNVARLFLEHVHGPLPAGRPLKNLCGLPQCVNPDHWSRPALPPAPYLLQPHPVAGWVVVESQTRLPPTRTVALRMRLPDALVHVVCAVPSSVTVPAVPLSTMCGLPVEGSGLLIVEAPVTCPGGC